MPEHTPLTPVEEGWLDVIEWGLRTNISLIALLRKVRREHKEQAATIARMTEENDFRKRAMEAAITVLDCPRLAKVVLMSPCLLEGMRMAVEKAAPQEKRDG